MSSDNAQYEFYDYKPDQDDMAVEVLDGLTSSPKFISPKYFYDARGSHLFEQITELEEYYLTRTEMALFDEFLPEIAATLEGNLCVVEYGSGSSMKVRKLLESVSPVAYVPVDISHHHLQINAQALYDDFPGMHVYPVCADITQIFELPPAVQALKKVGFFPGSSIGNFEPRDARAFLTNVRQTVGDGGALIIGVDRKKTASVLESAYNDSEGVTAEFNLNVLAHLNDALDADFELDKFVHEAAYDSEAGRIQMFLRSLEDQRVNVAGQVVHIAAEETLHTENSYKYDPVEFEALSAAAGFGVSRVFTDERGWFALYLLEANHG